MHQSHSTRTALRALLSALIAEREDSALLYIPHGEPGMRRMIRALLDMRAPQEQDPLAEMIAEGFGEKPVMVCLEADMAKALGHCLRLRIGEDRPCLCMDGLALDPGAYLDVGEPVGPALPVVIKTLVLSNR